MRALSNDIITKSAQQNQTIAAEAEPCVSLRISRNNMELTNMDLVEKIRVRRTNADTLTDADVAVQHPTFRGENTKVWVAYIHDGSLGLRWAYDTENLTDTSWNVVSLGAPSAVACAVAFNSDVVESDHGYFEYVTSEDYPLVFYVDSNGALHCISNGDPLSNVVLESSGVTDVTVIRGSASKAENWDYGLTAFYLKSGNLYYRQFLDGVWNTAGQVNHGISGETLSKIDAFATQDRKVGVQILTNSGKLYQIVTSDELPEPTDWIPKTWQGLTSFDGHNVWSDGIEIYYSGDEGHYKLQKETGTWIPYQWNGHYEDLAGRFVWSDGDNIYYSLNTTWQQYILDKTTYTWDFAPWSQGTKRIDGRNVWKDGNDVYYAGGHNYDYYSFDKLTKSWTLLSPVYIMTGSLVWTDGNSTYYSQDTAQRVFNSTTKRWSVKTWSGLSNFYGNYTWNCNKYTYYSRRSVQYALNKATDEWTVKQWHGLTDFDGDDVWSDGQHIFYSKGSVQYVLQY